jgi:hypothetical protein
MEPLRAWDLLAGARDFLGGWRTSKSASESESDPQSYPACVAERATPAQATGLVGVRSCVSKGRTRAFVGFGGERVAVGVVGAVAVGVVAVGVVERVVGAMAVGVVGAIAVGVRPSRRALDSESDCSSATSPV